MSKLRNNHIFTSESVSEGHPDKVCDQVSDAILDACLSKDAASRVACETAVTTNHFGRDRFPWEKTDKAKDLDEALGVRSRRDA